MSSFNHSTFDKHDEECQHCPKAYESPRVCPIYRGESPKKYAVKATFPGDEGVMWLKSRDDNGQSWISNPQQALLFDEPPTKLILAWAADAVNTEFSIVPVTAEMLASRAPLPDLDKLSSDFIRAQSRSEPFSDEAQAQAKADLLALLGAFAGLAKRSTNEGVGSFEQKIQMIRDLKDIISSKKPEIAPTGPWKPEFTNGKEFLVTDNPAVKRAQEMMTPTMREEMERKANRYVNAMKLANMAIDMIDGALSEAKEAGWGGTELINVLREARKTICREVHHVDSVPVRLSPDELLGLVALVTGVKYDGGRSSENAPEAAPETAPEAAPETASEAPASEETV